MRYLGSGSKNAQVLLIIILGRQIGSGMPRFLGVIVFGPLADFISLKDLVTACCSRLGFFTFRSGTITAETEKRYEGVQ